MSSISPSRNPFRHPEPEVIVAPSSPPLPPLPQRTASSELPPLPPRSSGSGIPTSSASGHEIPRDTSAPPAIDEYIDDDDLPPPYTPAANVSIGEETISVGPRRPFQQPPPLPSSSSSLRPSADPRSYSNRPSPPAQPYYRPDPRQGILAPWQTQQQYRQRQNAGGGLLGALFDTVRDIADVVSGAHDDRMMAARRANAGAYAVPYSNGDPASSVYAPPPGPPGQVAYQPSPPRRPASTPPVSPRPTVPDDGSPTRTPVPGHPLLRGGHLLVYPRDHLCMKCKNTGYKNYDPSHPCRKCWEKYAKSYTGALAYTPWSSSGNNPRMQRPLPKFVPPHLAPGSPSGSLAPPPQHPQHSRSISQPGHAPSGPSYYVLNPLGPYDATPPVPHAIPVSPGDPRLGGRLCVRCGGEGIRTVMLIDVMTCDDCGGTGRVWR